MPTEETLLEVFKTMDALIEGEFRFSVIHNAIEKRVNIVSSTNCDQIKHCFPEFNIYLSGRDKIVERVFLY